MVSFKPIEINDKEIFNEFCAINKDISSEYNFTTIFAWQEMYDNLFAIIDNCLCIKSSDSFLYPIGKKEDVKKALLSLHKLTKSENRPLIFISITQRMLDEIKEFGMEQMFKITSRRDLFDYIYSREKLVTLAGKKLHGKRNHFNFFQTTYNYKFVDLDDTNEKDYKSKLKDFIFERSLNPEREFYATLKVLKHRKALGFVSKCLYVDDTIVGIIMAENHNDSLLIQIAKSDVNFRGASVALFKFLIEESFLECNEVNFMEDMGIEGLRKMKLSYYPDYLIEKYMLEEII